MYLQKIIRHVSLYGKCDDRLINGAAKNGHSDDEISKAVEQGSFAYLMHCKADKIRANMKNGPVSMVIVKENPEDSIIVEIFKILPFNYDENRLMCLTKHDGKSICVDINELSSPEL